MKRNYLSGIALMLCSLSACTEENQLQPAYTGLTGNWAGSYETQQSGNCSWSGGPLTTTATFQVVDKTVTARVNQITGQTSVITQFTGTLNGNTVSLSKASNALCDGTPRTYINRFEGTISGNTLTMVSHDTVCPTQGCIFLRTLKLTRQ